MSVTGIITAVVVGIIIGALGRLVVPGRQNISIIVTMVIGIVAALLGTWIASLMVDTDGFSIVELLFQVGLAGLGVAIVAGSSGRPSVN